MNHFIAGVGASAGGLEALTELFVSIPKNLESRISFIVAQHLSPNYRSMLVQILSKESVFPVLEAEDNQLIEPGFIYITPPDFDIRVSEGKIHLSKPKIAQSPKPSVDMLLSSIAMEYGALAIGIILSGTGSDGAIGLAELKSMGGHTLIQNPDTAKYDGMPLASLQTGQVDYSLPPDKIGLKIEEIVLDKIDKTVIQENNGDLSRIFEILQHRFNTNFSNYKSSTILRRIDKRIKYNKFKDTKQYLAFLEKNPKEQQSLYQSFLINVTSFFRDTEAFEALERILEKKISTLGGQNNFRIWIPGCASGEEAYGIAMISQSLLDQYNKTNCVLQVFATDVDEHILQIARKGFYEITKTEGFPKKFLDKFMVKVENGYEVDKNLRSKILFSRQDITINPPFLKLDLLSCRNLLIYLDNAIQRQIYPVFHYALKEEGILFLGKSESIIQVEDLFDPIDTKLKIFKKRKFSSLSPSLKFSAFKPASLNSHLDRKKINTDQQLYKNNLSDTYFELTQHAYLVLSPLLDIVETKGDLRDFLQIPEGMLSLNINRLLRKEIQIEVKNLILQAVKEKKNIVSPLRKVLIQDKKLYIRIHCGLMNKNAENEREELYLLIFERFDLEEEIASIIPDVKESGENPMLFQLQEELNITKEHLQTYIEEIETANEELQSLNEELQSANEELQSSNEELETGNEELQSANEELQTAYAEIRHINQELIQKEQSLLESNSLFKALFANVQQGNILISEDYKINLINATAIDLLEKAGMKELQTGMNLLESFSEHVLALIIPLLKKTGKENIISKEIIEIPIQSDTLYYEFCFSPVKVQGEQRIHAIAMGILDMTHIRKNEIEIFQKDEMLLSLLNSNSGYLIRTDMEGRYTYVNDAFCEKFGFTREQCIGKYYGPTVHPDDTIECEKAVAKLFMNPNSVVTFEMRKPNPKGGFFYTEWEFVTIKNPKGEIVEVQGLGRDITPIKTVVKELEEERNQLEMTIWGGRLGTWDWDLESGHIKFNARWAEILGYDTQEVNHFTIEDWEKLIHPDDLEKVQKTIQDNIIGHSPYYEIEHRKKHKNGHWVWMLATGKVIQRSQKGKALRILGIHQDVTEKKKAEESTRISDERNAAILNTMQEGMILWDMNGVVISCNESISQILGINAQDLIGKSGFDNQWELLMEDESVLPRLESPSIKTLMTREAQKDKTFGLKKSEEDILWLSISTQLLYHPDTQIPYGFFAMIHNISDRKKIEKQFIQLNERFNDAMNSMSQGLQLIGFDWKYLYVNQVAAQQRKTTPEKLFGKSLKEEFPHIKGSFLHEVMEECMEKRISKVFEYEYELDDQSNEWFEFRVEPTQEGLLVITTNISERKKAEALIISKNNELASSEAILKASVEELNLTKKILQASEQHLSDLLNGMPVAVYTTDAEGYINFYNQAAETLWDRKPELGKEKWCGSFKLFDKDGQPIPHEDCPMGVSIRTNTKIYGEEAILETASGKRVHFLAHAIPFNDAGGNLLGAMNVIVDITERKKTKEKIRTSEESLNKAQRIAKIGSWDFNLLTFELVWSKEHYRIFELEEMPPNELYAAYRSKIHPDDIPVLDQIVQNAIEKGEGFTYEHRVLCKNGNLKFVVGIGEVVRNADSKPIMLSGTVQDITERKTSEMALQNEKQRFQDIVDSSEGIVWEMDYATFQFTYISQKAVRLLGYPVQEWYQPDFWFSHIHHEDRSWVQNFIIQNAQQSEPHEFEYRFHSKDGRILWLRDIANVVVENGQPKLLRGIMVDITERKKLEDELYKLSMVAQRTFNAVIITDTKKRILWANEAFTHITGYTLKEALGKTPRIFQFEGTDQETVRLMDEKLGKQEPVRVEIYNRGKYGQEYWLDLEIQPLFDLSNNHTGFMAVESDITTKKNAQKDVEHLLEITRDQNQRLREYTFITSHNIRSSVANLLSLTEMILDDSSNRDYLEMMQSSVNQLDATIQNLNQLLSIENDSQTMAKSHVNLLDAIHNNYNLIQNLFKDKVELSIEVSTPIAVFVIPAYLDSILNNLFTNAVKYRREGEAAKIYISASQNQEWTILSVKDNGIGIDLEKQGNKLFKMNSRLTNTVEGKGIGLFFTKHQIESMGGRIEVESQLGEGATFRVWFKNN